MEAIVPEMSQISLGLGLIQLGRSWGDHPHPRLPTDDETAKLIDAARGSGIRLLDTAPAYGASEMRLGVALKMLDLTDFIIATKAGEEWDVDTRTSTVDHSYDNMIASVRRSVERLGRVDILQIHKCTTEVLDLPSTFQVVKSIRQDFGIRVIGASVSDPTAAERALASGLFDCLQFPLNSLDQRFAKISREMASTRELAIVNRPFNMGKAPCMLHKDRVRAFEFIGDHLSRGVILTGTSDPAHLLENAKAFNQVFKLATTSGSGRARDDSANRLGLRGPLDGRIKPIARMTSSRVQSRRAMAEDCHADAPRSGASLRVERSSRWSIEKVCRPLRPRRFFAA